MIVTQLAAARRPANLKPAGLSLLVFRRPIASEPRRHWYEYSIRLASLQRPPARPPQEYANHLNHFGERYGEAMDSVLRRYASQA